MAQLRHHVGVHHLQRRGRHGAVLVRQGAEEAEGPRGGTVGSVENTDGRVEVLEAGHT